jgi:chaperonin cofactor prefoldin
LEEFTTDINTEVDQKFKDFKTVLKYIKSNQINGFKDSVDDEINKRLENIQNSVTRLEDQINNLSLNQPTRKSTRTRK